LVRSVTCHRNSSHASKLSARRNANFFGARMANYWDGRYQKNGMLWGEAVSPTCDALIPLLSYQAKVFELGFGYGRDLLKLLELGFIVSGIETSSEAFLYTLSRGIPVKAAEKARLILGRFVDDPLPEKYFDAFLSHRVLHLIEGDELEQTVQKISRVMIQGGIVCISARDSRDFDPSQMRLVSDGVAEYISKQRSGHRITFWNAQKFSDFFSPYFDSLRFLESEEVESSDNPHMKAYFTIMIGVRNSRDL